MADSAAMQSESFAGIPPGRVEVGNRRKEQLIELYKTRQNGKTSSASNDQLEHSQMLSNFIYDGIQVLDEFKDRYPHFNSFNLNK